MPVTDNQERNELVFPFYAKLAFVLIAVVLILFLMQAGKILLIPLFSSLLIAFVLLPVCKWLEKRKLHRGLAAFLSILLFISVISGVVFFLIRQIVEFSKDLPALRQNLQVYLTSMQGWIAAKYHVDSHQQIAYLNENTDALVGAGTAAARMVAVGAIGVLILIIFVFIFTFLILYNRNLFKKFITSLFARRFQTRVDEVVEETRLLANGYILGLLTEMLIIAVVNSLAFWIFGIKYALLLGVIAAILNIIPYIGIYTAAALGALITLANSTPGTAFTLIIILIVIHFLDANILMPRVVGRRVKMNPLITIIAVIAGNLVWGIPGMFLFIPLAAMMKLVFERVSSLKPWAILMGTEKGV